MLDAVFLAMFVIVAVLVTSIYLVRYRRMIRLHRKIQITLAIVLVVAIVGFEIDVRFVTDWRELAEASPFYESGFVDFWLGFHLCFAIPTPFIWLYVIVKAIKHYRPEAEESVGRDQANHVSSFGDHAATHRKWGKMAALFMIMTALTGCVFYGLAFVA
jgi:uncharacterized membrane protein YozB (DUF420 family)